MYTKHILYILVVTRNIISCRHGGDGSPTPAYPCVLYLKSKNRTAFTTRVRAWGEIKIKDQKNVVNIPPRYLQSRSRSGFGVRNFSRKKNPKKGRVRLILYMRTRVRPTRREASCAVCIHSILYIITSAFYVHV